VQVAPKISPGNKKNKTTIDILQSSHLVFPENISARTVAILAQQNQGTVPSPSPSYNSYATT
jgi:hypothetical protein